MKALKKTFCKRRSSRNKPTLLHRLGFKPRYMKFVNAVILASLCLGFLSMHSASAGDSIHPLDSPESIAASSLKIPSNHKMEPEESAPIKPRASRQGRQYDSPMSASGTGTYASVSGDSAYVAQLPVAASYGSASGGAATNYPSDMSANYQSAASYHDPLSMTRGYPSPMQPGYPSSYPPMNPITSMFSPTMGGGLLSPGASSMFPLMSKGFDISEIVCTAIAVAIGAVIVGAPFILIYLFIMNQMNGNGPNMGPNGGAISLTGPTSSTTVNGRKKRHTSFPEVLMKQLSPLVNSEQVAQTFKVLMNSIAKYQK